MSDRRRRRQAVLLVTVADATILQRPWDIPDSIVRGQVYVKNLSLVDAQGFVRTYNKRALETRVPDNLWALVLRHAHYQSDPGADLERPVDEASAEARLAAIAAACFQSEPPAGGTS